MFDILEADIVVLQEVKIQRKDLTDDMVLIPGWDCFFSLPRHKKGYSGVAIYTRQASCAPIKAEEGLTGTLLPPNSQQSFADLPSDLQIGGYPTETQISSLPVDARTLDSEGRCLILEFPGFVLLGVYSPANRDESRDEFRLSFLEMLDIRMRNLHALGKNIILTGDINISRDEIDSAHSESSIRKSGITQAEYISTPSRRLFNHWIHGGRVIGERDLGRDSPILWDLCRDFHPQRPGMFTCWEQKVNARPANCGARIDYVLCSRKASDWFSDSDIQAGLMGSDHCPVYADFKDLLQLDSTDLVPVQKLVMPKDYRPPSDKVEINALLPLSGRQWSAFSGRQDIRDMFKKSSSASKPTPLSAVNSKTPTSSQSPSKDSSLISPTISSCVPPKTASIPGPSKSSIPTKRTHTDSSTVYPVTNTFSSIEKKLKSKRATLSTESSRRGQQSLRGFFGHSSSDNTVAQTGSKASAPVASEGETLEARGNATAGDQSPDKEVQLNSIDPCMSLVPDTAAPYTGQDHTTLGTNDHSLNKPSQPPAALHPPTLSVIQPTLNSQTKEQRGTNNDSSKSDDSRNPEETQVSWSKLFSRPPVPRCEGHNEPCISLLTKKPGINLGRSFWMCPRPLGPSGSKEKGTEWRCQTFIWCSDWTSRSI